VNDIATKDPQKARQLHHVGIAVPSIAQATPVFELLTGATSSQVEELPEQGVRVAFVGIVELLEPLGPDTTVGRFLGRRGQGLHHLAFATDDIDAELARLRAEGMQLIDEHARPGAQGHRVAFIHPRSTQGVLTELVQVG